MFDLIRKDFLIAKKFVFISMCVIIAIPLFVALIAPSVSGIIPFLYMIIIGVLILLQTISNEEEKYPKAAALICATPYTRKTYVTAKYAGFFLVFIYCYIVKTIIDLIIRPDSLLDLNSVLLALLIGVIVYCIYMPFELKYGVVGTKYIFEVIVIVVSAGPIIFTRLFSNIEIDTSFLQTIPAGVISVALAVVSILVFAISLCISINIYSKKDL